MKPPNVKQRLTPKRPRRHVENDDFGSFARRIIQAYGRRVARGDIEALRALRELQSEVDAALDVGVAGLRREGFSWAEIGGRVGMSKQAAYQQWAAAAARLADQLEADTVAEDEDLAAELDEAARA